MIRFIHDQSSQLTTVQGFLLASGVTSRCAAVFNLTLVKASQNKKRRLLCRFSSCFFIRLMLLSVSVMTSPWPWLLPVSPQSIRLVSQYQDWLKVMEAIQGASARIQPWTWWADLTHRSLYIPLMHWFLFLTILFFYFSCFSICIQFFAVIVSMSWLSSLIFFVLSVVLLFLLLSLLSVSPIVLFHNLDLYCILHIPLLHFLCLPLVCFGNLASPDE